MPPPLGYRWSDKEWQLDESGPWMDSVLGIGRKIVGIYDVCGIEIELTCFAPYLSCHFYFAVYLVVSANETRQCLSAKQYTNTISPAYGRT